MGAEISNGIDKPAYFGDEAIINWHKQKWGCFSSSECVDLMTPGITPKGSTTPTMFGIAGASYIKRVAIQKYVRFHHDEKPISYAMKQGNINEPVAYSYIRQMTGYELTYHGGSNPLFKKYGDDFGASPDSVMYLPDGSAPFGAEIKCREDAAHWDFLDLLREKGSGIKGIHLSDFDYTAYCQCQANILCFDSEFWLYADYNEYYPLKDRCPIMKIEKDPVWQSKFKIRLKEAVKRRDNLIVEMSNR